MRAVFSVYGYGVGHATRTEAIINEFGKENSKVIASGDAFKYFYKNFCWKIEKTQKGKTEICK